MKLLGIIIAGVNPENDQVLIFSKVLELKSSSIFNKDTRSETFNFICRESLKGLDRGTRHKVFHEECTCYIQAHPTYKIGAFAFCEGTYPSNRVIYEGLMKSLEAFTNDVGKNWQLESNDKDFKVLELQKIFNDYKDVKKVSKVHEAQHEVDELKLILHDNIRQLLERQGQLEDLIDRSMDLKMESKKFLKETQKMDRKCCCTIF